MRVLYCTHTSEKYIGCAQLSDEQVVCGPNWITKHSEYGYTHIKTPSGKFNIQTVLDMLPQHQKPEMIVVWADSSCQVQPYNLVAFSGPKVLLIADTHHLPNPIERVIAYAKSEPWDFLVAFDNRHHLHFFREAGCKNIYWLPGLNAWAVPMDFNMERRKVITFVGQVGELHPRRRALLAELQHAGFPLSILQVPNAEALHLYSRTLISFECTLNSNVGLRTFEVLSAGGFLLADRPSMHSGMDLLFQDGKHLLYYDSFGDLNDKVKYLLDHPEEALPVAHAGYQEFWAKHSPEKKRQELMDLVWRGVVNPQYDLNLEPRMGRLWSISSQTYANRLEIYQKVQEVHKHQEQVRVLYDNQNHDYELIEDLLDLPRVSCDIVRSNVIFESEVEKNSYIPVNGRCKFVDGAGNNQQWDFIIPSGKKKYIQNGIPYSYHQLSIYKGINADIISPDKHDQSNK